MKLIIIDNDNVEFQVTASEFLHFQELHIN